MKKILLTLLAFLILGGTCFASLEDETGATSMRGSFVDGQAWFHDAGGLIAAYADTGNLLKINDGSGNRGYGFIGEVGTGEALGAELLTNGNMETADPPSSWDGTNSTLDGVADERTGGAGVQSLEVTATANGGFGSQLLVTVSGKLYKVDFWHKITAGDSCYVYIAETTGWTILKTSATYTNVAWENHSLYFTAETSESRISLVSKTSGDIVYYDDVSIKEVTEPNANAVHIYKEHSLTTEGWRSLDSGIDYNVGASWDFDIYFNMRVLKWMLHFELP